MAKKCDILTQTKLEEQYTSLRHRLFDLTTMPTYSVGPRTNKSLSSILPYFPHADKVDLLPICFAPNPNYRQYFSEDMRMFNCSIRYHPHRNLNEEIILTGNAPIPFSQLPEYYFEVTIIIGITTI
jgi:hypothetical protein